MKYLKIKKFICLGFNYISFLAKLLLSDSYSLYVVVHREGLCKTDKQQKQEKGRGRGVCAKCKSTSTFKKNNHNISECQN